MNPDKWKSVVIPLGSYKILRGMALDEHRTISGQFTYLLERWSEAKDQEQDGKK
tara:strand:+ start:346 stop:507 length:162 start_codon:yes stop_codon:yes gene_type:complete